MKIVLGIIMAITGLIALACTTCAIALVGDRMIGPVSLLIGGVPALLFGWITWLLWRRLTRGPAQAKVPPAPPPA